MAASPDMPTSSESTPLPKIPSEWEWWQWFARTEADYQINSSYQPQWWAKMIQPVWYSTQTYRHTVFFEYQSMFQSKWYTVCPGLGYRFLIPSDTVLLGINTFYNARFPNSIQQGSVGMDIQTQWVTLLGNYYVHLSGWQEIRSSGGISTSVKSLNGGDIALSAPLPHLPWLRLEAQYYHWGSINLVPINGYALSANVDIAGPLSIEAGISRDNVYHNNFILFSLRLGSPNRIQFSIVKDKITKAAFPPRDLRRYILEPVERESRVFNEQRETGSSGILIGRGT